jgi:7-cyano-7-deazaguanine synthase
MTEKAVVLVSGGLDSATTLAQAIFEGYACHALTMRYGQRHQAELDAATRLVQLLGAEEHKVLSLDLGAIGGSALTDRNIAVPQSPSSGIPVTYVPARNTVFLALALGWAEVLGARHIFIGVNAVDYSGYPDCRPEFIAAFEHLANLATKAGVEGNTFKLHTPLIQYSKAEIIRKGINLGVDFGLTVSCYLADEQGRACGRCDSCRLRRQGFEQAGVPDPTIYQAPREGSSSPTGGGARNSGEAERPNKPQR